MPVFLPRRLEVDVVFDLVTFMLFGGADFTQIPKDVYPRLSLSISQLIKPIVSGDAICTL